MTKKKPKHLHEPVGRPTVMTEATIGKLKEGFAQGFSVRNACIWADINQDTYFEYCKKHPKFSEQCKTLQQKPLIKSILVINKALNEGDVSTAKWYAERKGKDEFSLRQELTGEDGDPIKQDIKIDIVFEKGTKEEDF